MTKVNNAQRLGGSKLTLPSSLYAQIAFTNLGCWEEMGDIGGACTGGDGIALPLGITVGGGIALVITAGSITL